MDGASVPRSVYRALFPSPVPLGLGEHRLLNYFLKTHNSPQRNDHVPAHFVHPTPVQRAALVDAYGGWLRSFVVGSGAVPVGRRRALPNSNTRGRIPHTDTGCPAPERAPTYQRARL